MTISLLPPGLVLIVAGLLLPLARGPLRPALLLTAPLATLWLVWQVPDGIGLQAGFLDQQLVLLKGDKLSRLFATIFAIMALAGALFALNQPRTTELAAAFVYAGSAICVTFAGDLISVFVFWEMMAIASTIIIWSGTGRARAAGLRYAVIHMLGGVLLMAGIAGEIATTGTAMFERMDTSTIPRCLILAGVLVNAAAFPLSAWLPDSYPESSWSGMVFLSAFTTKTAVYVLLRGFPGTEILIWIGAAMVIYGVVYAVIESDMRRILAYSIVDQVGFMLVAIGIGTDLALNGAAAHAFSHILYKGVLLMGAGSVMLMTGRRNLADLGGLYRAMPITAACTIVGAMTVASLPLTSGFVAKAMITDSAAQQHLEVVWFLLMAGAAGVALNVGVRLPWFVFFGRNKGVQASDPPLNMRAAMVLVAALCIGVGGAPAETLYALLPYEAGYQPYTASHIVLQLQLVLFAGLAFALLIRWLKPTPTITLDVDWLWRGPGRALCIWLNDRSGRAWAWFVARIFGACRALSQGLYGYHGPAGVFGRTWPTGVMAFWMTLMLGAYLLLAYI